MHVDTEFLIPDLLENRKHDNSHHNDRISKREETAFALLFFSTRSKVFNKLLGLHRITQIIDK